MKEVKITRTITNTYIIGKTTHSGNITTIEKPYELIMGMDGISLIPMDKHIIGHELEYVTIKNDDTLYSVEPSSEVRNTYLEQLSGIEVPKQELIV